MDIHDIHGRTPVIHELNVDEFRTVAAVRATRVNDIRHGAQRVTSVRRSLMPAPERGEQQTGSDQAAERESLRSRHRDFQSIRVQSSQATNNGATRL
jgi:hypothetical protein